MQTLQEFITANTGKANVGDTQQNIGQCVGLIEVWTDNLGLPHTWGNAIDLLANADTNSFIVVLNHLGDTSQFPPDGAIVVLGKPYGLLADGTYAGHTGISVNSDGNTLRLFEANDPDGSAPHMKDYAYDSCIGWLIPKITIPTTPSTDPLQACLQQHDQLVAKCDQQSKTIDNLNQIITDKNTQITGLNTTIQTQAKQIEDLTTSLSSKTPIAEQLPQCQKELEQAIEDRKGLNKQIDGLNKTISGLSGTSYKTVKSRTLINELLRRALQRVGLA